MPDTKIKKRIKSKHLHIVLSPKELPEVLPLKDYLEKKAISYCMSVEYGAGANPHIDCFCEFYKEKRPDNFKQNVLKRLYNFHPAEWKNVRVSVNYIDENPKFGYGYTMKEKPEIYHTNLPEDYLKECVEYYTEHKDRVDKIKFDMLKTKDRVNQLTLDRVFADLVKWLTATHPQAITSLSQPVYHNFTDRDGRERKESQTFFQFYINLPYPIHHSLYSKINQTSIVFHAQCEIIRLRNMKDKKASSPE